MNANAGFEIVKQRPEMVLGESGGNLARRDGSVLDPFRNAFLSGDFCATCQALFTADKAFEDDIQAGEILTNKTSGNSGEKHGGFMHRLFFGIIPENDREAESSQAMVQPGLPTRALQRAGAAIGRGPSVLGDRVAKESRSAEPRRDSKSHAQTPSTAEWIPAAEGVVFPDAIALPGMTGQGPAVSMVLTGPHQAGTEPMTPIRETGESFRPSSDYAMTFPMQRTSESSPDGNASSISALPESGASMPDEEIESGSSPAGKKESANGDALATTDANAHQGQERASAQALHGGGPRELSPSSSLEKDEFDSNSAQLGTPKRSSPASPDRPQIREEAAGPQVAAHDAQPRQPAESRSIRVKRVDSQHFGAEIVRDSSAPPLIGSSHDIPEVARAARSSDAGLSGREVLAALDADRADSAPAWVRAGKHEVEAGYQDPDLGWVAVRAHSVTNGIHAALVPGSREAAQPLSEHLAGLNAYLADHHGGVHPVSITSPEVARDELSTGQGMDHGAAQGDRREQHAGSDAETGQDLARGSRQYPNLDIEPGDAIDPSADVARRRGTISLVV